MTHSSFLVVIDFVIAHPCGFLLLFDSLILMYLLLISSHIARIKIKLHIGQLVGISLFLPIIEWLLSQIAIILLSPQLVSNIYMKKTSTPLDIYMDN
jgi:hypothetical protein